MTDGRVGALAAIVRDAYGPADYPALAAQTAAWTQERPLARVRVVDATPVFRNTVVKHLALLAAGADLIVAALPALPSDPAVLDLLRAAEVPVVTGAGDLRAIDHVDVACDCAGVLTRLEPRYGAVELTRSGVAAYAGSRRPVVVVDDSRLKAIETSLGTGDGFVRAMRQLGHGGFAGRTVVVFGAGKVGLGVALASRAAGASVTLVDAVAPQGRRDWRKTSSGRGAAASDRPPAPMERDGTSPGPGPASSLLPGRGDSHVIGASSDSELVDAADEEVVVGVIARAWCVVTATGVPGAVARYARELRDSAALLANMGVADEFGPDVPGDRVLHGKAPLNFLLTEPTRARYLDPVFALSNAAALHLVRGEGPAGVEPPPPVWEDEILTEVLAHGALAAELREALPGLT